MKAATLSASDGWPLTGHPGAGSCTATRLLLQMPRSSCIVLHGVDLKFSPAPGELALSEGAERCPRANASAVCSSVAGSARSAESPRLIPFPHFPHFPQANEYEGLPASGIFDGRTYRWRSDATIQP
jgi:hypothetical protein